MSSATIHLGYEVDSGEPVAVPVKHTVITGQTQEAGKTTALEAMISRSGLRAITFVTKRGEGSFTESRRIEPYFREQADWQFVASILEASRGEKLKFERAWIIRASKGARTLADVHRNVRASLEKKSTGKDADVYTVLDAYLEVVVPLIEKVKWATSVDLKSGVNVMDLAGLAEEMQHLVIRSSVDWVLGREEGTVVVVPEAWKFLPQGRGTPVKLAAEKYIRQAAGLNNYLWLDSQDIAGVEKIILKSCPLWILGVQREFNEVQRTLAQIPAGIKKPKPEQISTLSLGQFYACWGTHVVKVYVQPTWMSADDARRIAKGERVTVNAPPGITRAPEPVTKNMKEEPMSANAEKKLDTLIELLSRQATAGAPTPVTATTHAQPPAAMAPDEESLYQRIKSRLITEAPAILKVLEGRPELVIEVERHTVTADGSTVLGRVALMIRRDFFASAQTFSKTKAELERTGTQINNKSLSVAFKQLVKQGFLTDEGTNGYQAVKEMKVRVVDR